MTTYQIQLLLLYLGYSPGNPDGLDGPSTRAAVKKFQQDFGGIGVDGIAGEETQKALKHAVAYGIEKNATGNATETTGTFWDEIKHFTREEFKCKCGGAYCDGAPAVMRHKLLVVADRVREHFGAAAIVSSGLRCKTHNANEGGVSNSRHMYGKAMDFRVLGISADTLLAYVKAQPEIRYAYKIDSNYVHMDVE